MKRKIKWYLAGIGLALVVIIACIVKKGHGASVTVIGGADGPTSIFLAGKVGTESGLAIVVLVLIVLGGIVYAIRKRR